MIIDELPAIILPVDVSIDELPDIYIIILPCIIVTFACSISFSYSVLLFYLSVHTDVFDVLRFTKAVILLLHCKNGI